MDVPLPVLVLIGVVTSQTLARVSIALRRERKDLLPLGSCQGGAPALRLNVAVTAAHAAAMASTITTRTRAAAGWFEDMLF